MAWAGVDLHCTTGKRDHKLHGLVPGGAGVAVGGEGEDAVSFDDLFSGGIVFFSKTKRSTRQRNCNGIRCS